MGLSGITGYVSLGPPSGGVLYNFDRWKVAFKCKAPDTTGQMSSGYGSCIPGRLSATVTCSGPYDGEMPLVCGTVYEFHLGFIRPDPTAEPPVVELELMVEALVTALEPENDYNDRPSLSVTAESVGPIDVEVV